MATTRTTATNEDNNAKTFTRCFWLINDVAAAAQKKKQNKQQRRKTKFCWKHKQRRRRQPNLQQAQQTAFEAVASQAKEPSQCFQVSVLSRSQAARSAMLLLLLLLPVRILIQIIYIDLIFCAWLCFAKIAHLLFILYAMMLLPLALPFACSSSCSCIVFRLVSCQQQKLSNTYNRTANWKLQTVNF